MAAQMTFDGFGNVSAWKELYSTQFDWLIFTFKNVYQSLSLFFFIRNLCFLGSVEQFSSGWKNSKQPTTTAVFSRPWCLQRQLFHSKLIFLPTLHHLLCANSTTRNLSAKIKRDDMYEFGINWFMLQRNSRLSPVDWISNSQYDLDLGHK